MLMVRVTQQNDPQNSHFINHVIGKENLLESNKSWVLLGRMDSNQVQFGERFFCIYFSTISIKGGEAILDVQYFLFSSTLTEVEIRKLPHTQHKEFRCNIDHLSASSGV